MLIYVFMSLINYLDTCKPREDNLRNRYPRDRHISFNIEFYMGLKPIYK